MGFLNRFRSPEEIERRAREKAERDAEATFDSRRPKPPRQAAADRARREAEAIAVFGPDLAGMTATTPAEAKIAIKLARLRKKELQAEQRS